jgi:hypothetical protein
MSIIEILNSHGKYNFINEEKKIDIDNNIKKTKDFINENLLSIIKSTGEKLEGNIFMLHETTEYTNRMTENSTIQNLNNSLPDSSIRTSDIHMITE